MLLILCFSNSHADTNTAQHDDVPSNRGKKQNNDTADGI